MNPPAQRSSRRRPADKRGTAEYNARLLRRASLGSGDTDALFAHLRSTGDQRAREELVYRFMPLARKLASRYVNPHEPLQDLVQVASLGLVGAIDRFDPGRGTAFSSFAVPTILGELKRHFRSTGWSAHVPRRAQELSLRIDKAAREISFATGRSPSVADLVQYLELCTEDVLTGLDASRAHYSVSLDVPSGPSPDEGDPEPLGSTIGADDDGFALADTRIALTTALGRLPRPEREALALHAVADLKQVEIAKRLGCSQMQVSRLLKRAATHVGELTTASGPANGERRGREPTGADR